MNFTMPIIYINTALNSINKVKHEYNTHEYYTRVSLYLYCAFLDFYVEVFENHFFGFCIPQSFVGFAAFVQFLTICIKRQAI